MGKSYDKQWIKILKKHGFEPTGKGVGSHEVWQHKHEKHRVATMVRGSNKRHTINAALKKAGIDEKL